MQWVGRNLPGATGGDTPDTILTFVGSVRALIAALCSGCLHVARRDGARRVFPDPEKRTISPQKADQNQEHHTKKKKDTVR